MKIASVRQIQHHLAEVLAWVESGEEVHVFRRKKLIARLVPVAPEKTAAPDFVGRAKEIWGARPKGKPLSRIVADDRGER